MKTTQSIFSKDIKKSLTNNQSKQGAHAVPVVTAKPEKC